MIGGGIHLVERRVKERYPLDLTVRFRCSSAEAQFSGEGLSINISSGGVLVRYRQPASEYDIGVGTLVEMRIEWPSLLDGKVPLQLCSVGRVVRHSAASFAATLGNCQFRTMRPSLQRADQV